MAKIKEQDLEQYLKSLDKKTLIGLYLQKTFDDDYIISDLKHQLYEKNEFLRRYQYHYSEPYAIDNKKLKEQLVQQRKEICREIAEECVKHVELIDFGNNHSEFMILASDLNECLNEVIKRR